MWAEESHILTRMPWLIAAHRPHMPKVGIKQKQADCKDLSGVQTQ